MGARPSLLKTAVTGKANAQKAATLLRLRSVPPSQRHTAGPFSPDGNLPDRRRFCSAGAVLPEPPQYKLLWPPKQCWRLRRRQPRRCFPQAENEKIKEDHHNAGGELCYQRGKLKAIVCKAVWGVRFGGKEAEGMAFASPMGSHCGYTDKRESPVAKIAPKMPIPSGKVNR